MDGGREEEVGGRERGVGCGGADVEKEMGGCGWWDMAVG